MDVTAVANSVVAFLAPFLPYLLRAGKTVGTKAAEEASKKLGADTWEQAKTLWGKLRGKRKVVQAAQKVAKAPDDADAQAALRLQIRKLLDADPALAEEVAGLLKEAPARGSGANIQQQAGDNSIQIGQARDIKIER